MISDDDILNTVREARGDGQMAFVKLERTFRETLQNNLRDLDNASYDVFNEYYLEYMNHTIAAAIFLEIDGLKAWPMPSHSVDRIITSEYKDFAAAVDRFSMQVRLSAAHHAVLYNVHLTPDAKKKIHYYAEKIRELIERSDISTEKREELLARLNKFLAEVDRDRTRMEVVGDFLTGYAYIVGESVKELDPIKSWLELIARLLGKAQEDEPARLPPPETRRIPAPPRQLPAPKRKLPDDDVPF